VGGSKTRLSSRAQPWAEPNCVDRIHKRKAPSRSENRLGTPAGELDSKRKMEIRWWVLRLGPIEWKNHERESGQMKTENQHRGARPNRRAPCYQDQARTRVTTKITAGAIWAHLRSSRTKMRPRTRYRENQLRWTKRVATKTDRAAGTTSPTRKTRSAKVEGLSGEGVPSSAKPVASQKLRSKPCSCRAMRNGDRGTRYWYGYRYRIWYISDMRICYFLKNTNTRIQI
jgi:hypothetical protein